MKITVEPETPNDSSSMFRGLLDEKFIGADLTAVQDQLVVAEIIERFVLQARIKSSPAEVGAAVPNFLRG